MSESRGKALGRVARRLTALGLGAVRHATGGTKRGDAGAQLLSSDVFATLIARRADDNAAERAGTLTFARLARQAGLAVPADVAALRRRSEASLTQDCRARGEDPDFTNAATFAHMARTLGAADVDGLARASAAAQAEWELKMTRPIEALWQWYDAAARAGQRVVAISDTRYSGEDLTAILNGHGYDRLAHVYSSADYAACKFSGRLFDRVVLAEQVAPGAISHRGDSLPADVLAPAQRGLRVEKIAFPPAPLAASPLPALPLPATAEAGYTLGFTQLGPVFAAFVRLVLAQAYGEGIEHLAFVARDGDLPLQVAKILSEALPEDWRPRLSYVAMSRRSLTDVSEADGTLSPKGHLAAAYLTQAGIFDSRTALVDIGWRGSIHDQVCTLARQQGVPAPRAYYMALWNEDHLPDPKHGASGILGDQRRDRGPREGSAWYAALLLEGVARAPHGTVLDYAAQPDGSVAPVFATQSAARAAEVDAQRAQESIRAGVLDYARALAKVDGIAAPPHPRRTRAAAQAIMFNLAFFPDANARAVGRQLVHSESTDDFLAMLVQAPGKGLAGRLRALRSPWKGAGFYEVGGRLAACAYLLVETAFCYLPLGLKTRLRERMGPPPSDA